MTPNQIRARLLERDSNLTRFSSDYGYHSRTVHQVVKRHVNTGRVPRGILTWKILRDLSKAVGEPVIEDLNGLID